MPYRIFAGSLNETDEAAMECCTCNMGDARLRSAKQSMLVYSLDSATESEDYIRVYFKGAHGVRGYLVV